MLQRESRAVEVGIHVDGHHVIPPRLRGVVDCSHGTGIRDAVLPSDSGIVDEHVNSAVLVDRRINEVLAALLLGEIGGEHHSGSTQ